MGDSPHVFYRSAQRPKRYFCISGMCAPYVYKGYLEYIFATYENLLFEITELYPWAKEKACMFKYLVQEAIKHFIIFSKGLN